VAVVGPVQAKGCIKGAVVGGARVITPVTMEWRLLGCAAGHCGKRELASRGNP
jgi:hypothetical protein